MLLTERQRARVWSRILQTHGCWEWQGARYPTRYGHLRLFEEDYYAHRVVWTMLYGPIPAGMYICHHCDNPPCCRPDHLYLGTASENAQDRETRGRHPHARVNAGSTLDRSQRERKTSARLTPEQVRAIRSQYSDGHTSYRRLAREYRMSTMAIAKLVRGETWGGVADIVISDQRAEGGSDAD